MTMHTTRPGWPLARPRQARSLWHGARPHARRARGMTLIELMVAVAIVGILASVAYPSYMDTVRKGRRADAQTVLLEAAQFMERFATENQRFDRNRALVAVALPSTLAKSPKDSATTLYTISLQSVTADAYTLQAVPAGTMVGDACGTLTLTATGVKGAGKTGCWGR